MCLEKSERNCLTSYLYNEAILASFFLFTCLKGCFRLSLSTRNKKKRTVTSKKHALRPANLYRVYYSLKETPKMSHNRQDSHLLFKTVLCGIEATRNPKRLIFEGPNQGNRLSNDSFALKTKDRLHPDRVNYGLGTCLIKRSGLQFVMPHVQFTCFSSFQYTGFNIGCHAGHLIVARAIFSLMTLAP